MFGSSVTAKSVNRLYADLKTSKRRIIEADHDVFGDGTVVLAGAVTPPLLRFTIRPLLKFTPGHTPGHQSLYVKLAKTGGVVLSGDLYHYPEERTLNRMPEREKTTGTAASRLLLENFMREVGAEL